MSGRELPVGGRNTQSVRGELGKCRATGTKGERTIFIIHDKLKISYKIQYRDMKKKKTNSQMMNWDLFFFDDCKCLRLNKMPKQIFTGKSNTS